MSPLTRISKGSISAIAGYPKLPYPILNIRIWDVNDKVGTSKLDSETQANIRLVIRLSFDVVSEIIKLA